MKVICIPKPPNPKSKTLRLVLIPKNGQDDKIRAFKEICARNNKEISDILFEKVEEFLRKHNWPPGNSQTILVPKQLLKCGLCNECFKHVWRVKYLSGKIIPSCKVCIEKKREKDLIRKVLGLM